MGKYRLEIKWGIFFTLAAILWMTFEKLMGWHGENIAQHAKLTNLFSIVAVAIYLFALRDKKRQLGGTMTWKEGFISGAIISVIVAILSPFAQYLTNFVISPEYFPNAIEYAVSSGNATEEEAEAFFNFKNYAMMGSVGALVMGLITAAVVAFFVRSKPTA